MSPVLQPPCPLQEFTTLQSALLAMAYHEDFAPALSDWQPVTAMVPATNPAIAAAMINVLPRFLSYDYLIVVDLVSETPGHANFHVSSPGVSLQESEMAGSHLFPGNAPKKLLRGNGRIPPLTARQLARKSMRRRFNQKRAYADLRICLSEVPGHFQFPVPTGQPRPPPRVPPSAEKKMGETDEQFRHAARRKGVRRAGRFRGSEGEGRARFRQSAHDARESEMERDMAHLDENNPETHGPHDAQNGGL